MLNKIVLIGRLTSDPSIKYTQNGKAVSRLTLAVERPYKNSEGNKLTDFIPVISWGKLAEIVAQYMEKGKMVAVTGSLEIRAYEENGVKKYIAEVIADDVRFLDKKETENPFKS